MGIKIELTDKELPEVAQEIEISEEEVQKLMENPPAECAGMEDKILFTVETHEDGSIEIRPGKKGYILLHTEKEAEDFCECIIRQIRHLPTFQRNPS